MILMWHSITVGLAFDNSLDYELLDIVTVEIVGDEQSSFNYRLLKTWFLWIGKVSWYFRINDVWLTTDSTANQPYESIRSTQRKIKVIENGCQKIPIAYNTGTRVGFYAVGFAEETLPQNLYLRATILPCSSTVDCTKTCSSITASFINPDSG